MRLKAAVLTVPVNILYMLEFLKELPKQWINFSGYSFTVCKQRLVDEMKTELEIFFSRVKMEFQIFNMQRSVLLETEGGEIKSRL